MINVEKIYGAIILSYCLNENGGLSLVNIDIN